MNADAVFWGAIICIAGSVVVVVVLAVRIGRLINKDTERNQQ
ncbi:hypothetical protein MNBD_GAMMA26-1389 [hydrothermal vent metagenome]|uniref:Uncharacterized protein n=1 Tax=hydrothermal vent metagenome TaxID=652676 RepID=A0A3B1BMY4_9ZZZZ